MHLDDTSNPRAVHANAPRSLLYRVRDWDAHFEVAQSKRVKGPLRWVPLPCKHDGKGFRRLMRESNGAALYGAWCCSLGVAAKCPERGTLADDDGPLTCEDLELKTGCPASVFEVGLPLFVELGWMIAENWDAAAEGVRVVPQVASESLSDATTTHADSEQAREPDVIVPSELAGLLDALQDLPPSVAPSVRENELPELVELWEHARRDAPQALCRLADVPQFVEAVRRSNFLHGKPWFSVAWLLKRGREGPTRNFEKLLDGAYCDDGRGTNGRRSLDAIDEF